MWPGVLSRTVTGSGLPAGDQHRDREQAETHSEDHEAAEEAAHTRRDQREERKERAEGHCVVAFLAGRGFAWAWASSTSVCSPTTVGSGSLISGTGTEASSGRFVP